ncbi:RluA family pseudouridine synthase [Thiomicrorhabdus indica]|uniref:RluA family pseudouridine synthase n=1 Tax=Thiomicrorhabdus indica TaxID=2267253 RepID=UPI001F0F6CDB|nr:RluA family pseudouridine synthase [Thiomicrorhabdus indica]
MSHTKSTQLIIMQPILKKPILTSRVHSPAGIIRQTPPPELKTFKFDENWILFEDRSMIVVNKPSGLLSVPGRGEDKQHSMQTLLQQNCANEEIHVIHRLDMDTSGLMVFAKNKEAHRHLSRQFQERQTQKRYEAVCTGRLEIPQGECKLPIRCDWEFRPLQMVDFLYGKPSHTQWQLLQQAQNHFVVELTPITGRSHQLRLHMKMLGHPILGDNLYADNDTLNASTRLMLHAKMLGLTHPESLNWLSFNSPSHF